MQQAYRQIWRQLWRGLTLAPAVAIAASTPIAPAITPAISASAPVTVPARITIAIPTGVAIRSPGLAFALRCRGAFCRRGHIAANGRVLGHLFPCARIYDYADDGTVGFFQDKPVIYLVVLKGAGFQRLAPGRKGDRVDHALETDQVAGFRGFPKLGRIQFAQGLGLCRTRQGDQGKQRKGRGDLHAQVVAEAK